MSMDFSSWPRDQEQQFVVFEQRQQESHRKAFMAAIIASVAFLVLALGVYAGVERRNARGEETEVTVRAGWTFDQILNMLMNLDQMITPDGAPNLKAAAGLLTPERISGAFETDDFKVTFENKPVCSSRSTCCETASCDWPRKRSKKRSPLIRMTWVRYSAGMTRLRSR